MEVSYQGTPRKEDTMGRDREWDKWVRDYYEDDDSEVKTSDAEDGHRPPRARSAARRSPLSAPLLWNLYEA
jgi:hypothetical protein